MTNIPKTPDMTVSCPSLTDLLLSRNDVQGRQQMVQRMTQVCWKLRTTLQTAWTVKKSVHWSITWFHSTWHTQWFTNHTWRYEIHTGNHWLFSKWTEAYALPDFEALSWMKTLYNQFFAHFGLPINYTAQGWITAHSGPELEKVVYFLCGIFRAQSGPTL